MYVTVLVTTSRMCLTLVRDGFCFLISGNLALMAASQSNTECTGLALNGDRMVLALNGDSMFDTAGLGGSLKLGNEAAHGGADIGANGLGGKAEGPSTADGLPLSVDFVDTVDAAVEVDKGRSSLGRFPSLSASGLLLTESGLESPDVTDGELRTTALDKKSV